jgi:hypothetical protein
MKNLLASAALLVAVSACSGEAEEPAAPVEEATEAPAAVTMESYVGTWTVTPAEGEAYTAVNNADGTYTDTMPDGSTVSGTWAFGADQSCWTPAGGEEQCLAVGLEDENGTVTLTGADGVQFSATRVPAEAAPTAEVPAAG